MPEQSGTRPSILWLEDITGDDALDWVRAHNEPTSPNWATNGSSEMRAEALEVLDTDSRIPYVRRRGEHLYNFWRDAANPRGLWRRTTLDELPHRRSRLGCADRRRRPGRARTARTGCGPVPTSSNPI